MCRYGWARTARVKKKREIKRENTSYDTKKRPSLGAPLPLAPWTSSGTPLPPPSRRAASGASSNCAGSAAAARRMAGGKAIHAGVGNARPQANRTGREEENAQERRARDGVSVLLLRLGGVKSSLPRTKTTGMTMASGGGDVVGV